LPRVVCGEHECADYNQGVQDVILVREWDADQFHARVMELEKQGYVTRRETYRILAEMNPETGWVSHVHSIELTRPEPNR
jgi:hypothetical protein